jgi:serine/threonine-protein kinase
VAEPLRLDNDLIESVADGRPVDWEARARHADPGQRRAIRHLRLVADVAAMHRTAGDDSPLDPPTVAAPSSPALSQWGHLALVERIGEGAFGEVYRARDSWLDHEVALKLLKPGAHPTAGAVRILGEARALARVRHHNVVTVHGADQHEGRVGLWMELVRGRTLAQIVAAQGPFGAREAGGIGQDVCRALAAVHAEGLIHKDVKAQNVMRASGGRIVLMDFGAGHTPIYLAPETLAGRDATVASDVYAVGVLLYFLVTARFPVNATSATELQAAHARGERRRLTDQRADLPDEFVAVVERALDSDPARRYASAGEMLEALLPLQSAPAPAQAAPPSAPLPLVTAPSRRPWWRRPVVGATLAAALTLSVAAVWWSMSSPASRTSEATTAATGEPARRTNSDVRPVRLVAILPLRSDASDTEYFADGMTDALMQGLSRLQNPRVVSRTSVARAMEVHRTLPEMAHALGADAVLEGSVHQIDGRVRVNLRLIHAGSDTPVWSRAFEETLENVFELQSRVAGAVVEEWGAAAVLESAQALARLREAVETKRRQAGGRAIAVSPRVITSPDELATPSALQATFQRVVDADAYDAYMRGRYEFKRLTQSSVETALRYFETSAKLDPTFARALVGLAESHLVLANQLRVRPVADSAARARDAARRAAELDPTLAEAHATLGAIAFEIDWNFAAAEQAFSRAIALDPSLVTPREQYAMFLASRRRFDESFAQLGEARRVDPLSATVADRLAAAYYYARLYDRALDESHRALQLDPESMGAHVGRGRILSAMGRYSEAIAEYDKTELASTGHPFYQLELAHAEIAGGRTESARARIRAVESRYRAGDSRASPYMMALAYGRLDRNAAFEWLERESQQRSSSLVYLAVDPRADVLRADPRFLSFAQRFDLNP